MPAATPPSAQHSAQPSARKIGKKHASAAPGRNPAAVLADPPYLNAETQKALADRLARIEGHVGSVKRMVLEQRCADDILLQVAAVKAALNQVSGQIIEKELTTCVTTCMPGDAEARLKKVTTVLTTLLKQG